MEDNRMFKVLVIGDNPDKILEEYDSNKKTDQYVVYEADKAGEYRQRMIKNYTQALDFFNEDSNNYRYLKACIEDWTNMSDSDFYLELTEGYEIDEDTGNAVSDKNPKGMYDYVTKKNVFAEPFILKDGTEAFIARKKDIDWDKIHLSNPEPYEVAWDTVMEGRQPKNDEEKAIYENMKERTRYFMLFENRENYIKSNTAFWAYAVVTKDGWKEIEGSQFEWVSNFYDRFIKPLPDNTTLSIYECGRN